jgi:hypothetical protein
VRAIVKIVSPAVVGMCAVVEKAPNAKSMFGLVREWRCAASINAWAARRLRVPGMERSSDRAEAGEDDGERVGTHGRGDPGSNPPQPVPPLL